MTNFKAKIGMENDNYILLANGQTVPIVRSPDTLTFLDSVLTYSKNTKVTIEFDEQTISRTYRNQFERILDLHLNYQEN